MARKWIGFAGGDCWLGEVSCLADCQRHVKEFFPIFLYTSRLMVQYARYRGLDALVAAVHPKHARFYRRFMDFQVFGLEKTYPTVRNHPAVALWLEFARIDREIPAAIPVLLWRKDPVRRIASRSRFPRKTASIFAR